MVKIKAIHNDADLDEALERIGELLHYPEGSPESEELDALSDLVIDYEAIHYPIPDPSPADMVQGRLDALGLLEDDLVPCLGSREAVDAVLAGQRSITPAMAEALSQLLGIEPQDLLLPEGVSQEG